MIWFDEDADGFQDSAEKGLAGVTVSLTNVSGDTVTDVYGEVIPPQQTGANGLYLFDNLPADEYVVYVSPPAEYFLSPGGQDVDDNDSNSDSNCYVSDDGLILTRALTLSENAEPVNTVDGDDANGNLTVDCGFYRTMSVGVGSRIWLDLDADSMLPSR